MLPCTACSPCWFVQWTSPLEPSSDQIRGIKNGENAASTETSLLPTLRQRLKLRYPATERTGAANVNANTKMCHAFEKLKLLRKMSARSAESPDRNRAKTVTTEKTIQTALSNRRGFFSMFISSG